ncbi:MAG: oligosaccharide flippase family protein [Gemmatimonadaceae bacterium]
MAEARTSIKSLLTLGPNFAWATLGTVFNQGSTFVSNIIIANLLGKSVFGEFAIVLTTVQATAAFASLGVGYTSTRYLAEWRHRDAERAGQLLGLFSRVSWIAAIISAALLGASSLGLANSALHAPSLGPAILIASASAVFMVRNGFLMGALAGLESFRSLGLSGLLSGTVYLALTVGGASYDGVRGAAVGLGLSLAFQCATLTVSLRRERRLQSLAQSAASFLVERPLLMRFAVPAALSGFSTVPVLWAVQAFLARSPNAFGEVAVYSAGLNLLAMVMFAPTILNGLAMAWINRTNVVEGDAAYRSALRTNVAVNAAIVVCALLVMAAIGPSLLGLFGRDFRSGYVPLLLLLAAALPEAVTNALSQSLQKRERMWHSFLAINVPRDLVIVTAAFFLVPTYGATGAATAYLTGRVIAVCAMYLLVRDEVNGTIAVNANVALGK